jgi:hypothetical protein
MKTFKYIFLFTALVALLISGCESLDVKNENDPDFATAFSQPSDVKGVAGGLINTWFMSCQDYDGPALALWVGADAGTCSHGNSAMRDFSYEPRIAWDNTPSYGNAIVSENFYKGMYSLLSSSNEILAKVVTEGMEITADNGTDETPMVKAMAYLGQGLGLGYIGLFFDQGFVVTEETDLSVDIPVSPYMDLINTAVQSLDKCIAVCESSTFTLPSSWIPGMTYTQVEIGQLANSMAARLLSFAPRNKAENDAVNWATVLSYANKGLTYDFAPLMDDVNWYDLYHTYAPYQGWGQVDMRVVNMMDPAMPDRWTLGPDQWAVLPDPVTSHKDGVDDRIFTDFQHLTSCGFRVERGYYHFSNYRYARHDEYLSLWTTPSVVFYKAENDLLKAEALWHQSNYSGAADIINAGPRVTRGGLAPVAAVERDVELAIFHERHVELFCSGLGIEFCTMRKADKLQPGTPLHFPIPGQQLEVNIMEPYTFGPGKGVAGQDYSTGGWF